MAAQAPDNVPDLRLVFDKLSAMASKFDEFGAKLDALRRKVDSGVTSDQLDVRFIRKDRTGPFVVCRGYWPCTRRTRKSYGISTRPIAFQVSH